MGFDFNQIDIEQSLMFSNPVKYDEHITLYPIKMKDYLIYQWGEMALTLRKDAIFHDKQILKMGYLSFIKYASKHPELSTEYHITLLPLYYNFILQLLNTVCGADSKIEYNTGTLDIYINGEFVTDEMFDTMRRIIFVQNDIDFDIDEFMNIDTVNALERARRLEQERNKETAKVEDYIDSLIIALSVTEEYVSNLSIRKFWRFVKRVRLHEQYDACLHGQMGGMVTFKEPLKYWMTTLEVEDKYGDLKTEETELKEKIG